MQDDTENLFRERQKFNQWYIWTPLLIICLLPIALIGLGLAKEERSGVFITAGIGCILILLFSSIHFKTKYNKEGITVSLFPFMGKRMILWRDVESYSIQPYKFVGYGVRYALNSNTVYYNISGNVGIHLLLKDGEKIVVGTREPAKLSDFIEKLKDQAFS